MKRINRIISAATVVALSFGLLTGCGNASDAAAAKAQANSKASSSASSDSKDSNLNQARTIRIGDQNLYYPVKVAITKGFFKEEFGDDYKFEVSTFVNGPASVEAFNAGQLDIGQFGDLPAVQAYANGTDLKIISTLWESDNAYWIVAGKDSGISKVGDLKGKKIGVPAGTNQHKFVEKVISKEGFTNGKDITVVNLDSDAATAALISGDVDAIEVDTGNLDKVLQQTGGTKITNNKDYEPSTVVILANDTFAKENPDTVVRFLKVLDKTNKWITENQDEADQIVADTVGGTKEDAHEYYGVRNWSIGWNQDMTDTINGTIQFAEEQGNISKKFDASDLVDTSYLEKAGLYKKQ